MRAALTELYAALAAMWANQPGVLCQSYAFAEPIQTNRISS